MHTKEKWQLEHNIGWSTNALSIIVRKRRHGVGTEQRPNIGHQVTIVNFPAKKTVPYLEIEANAQLIVHAPEMLELLRRFIGWYSNKEPDNYHKVMPFKNQPPEIQDAMKLIEKITGESYV